MKVITSVNNSQVKAWTKLNTKKGRLKQGKYLLDGWHLVKEAIRTNASIETIMVDPNFKHMQEITVPEGTDMIQITDNVVKHLSDTKHPQGISANSLTAARSSSVVVGDFNNKVSEIIADNIIPAIFLGTSILCSLYSFKIIVLLHPSGSA